MALKIIGMKEILQVFDVTDNLGISREMIEIPLSPEHPGRVRKLPNGKFEIIIESEESLAEWIPRMEKEISKLYFGEEPS
jgi:hypothetical protein